MLCLLSRLTLSRKPVILIPGLCGSQIKADIKGADTEWYCPRNLKDTVIWINEERMIPPLYNCVFKWLGVKLDKNTHTQTELKGVNLSTVDFGGLGGINQLDRMPKNFSFIPYYHVLIKKLKDLGYAERVDLFGAPNDWRYGMSKQDDFFKALKGLVEEAYEKNHEKVVLVGHSFGGFLAHYFCDDYVDPEWLEKYIDSNVLLSPSFAGASYAIHANWARMFPTLLPSIKELGNLLESLGGTHIHYPNYEIYRDQTIIIAPNGTHFGPEKVFDVMVEQGKFKGDNIELFKFQIPYISKFPSPSRAKTRIIFNKGYSTRLGLDFSNGWDKPKEINDGGDLLVLSGGLEKYCEANKDNKNLECIELNRNDLFANHLTMLYDDEFLGYVTSVL